MNSLVQKQMIVWTLGLVLFFALAVGLTLLEPPSTLALQKPEAKSADREPASIPSTAAAELPSAIHFDPGAQVSDFKVNCDATADSALAATVQQVRLRGDTCLQKKKIKLRSAQIKNVTNGFIATVFLPDDSRFSTDYINLHKGENKIEINMIFTDGTRLARKVQFTRQ